MLAMKKQQYRAVVGGKWWVRGQGFISDAKDEGSLMAEKSLPQFQKRYPDADVVGIDIPQQSGTMIAGNPPPEGQ